MAAVFVDITMSLDGFVAGPGDAPGKGLGEGGEPLHYWVMGGPVDLRHAADHPARRRRPGRQ